ncbi:MAG: DUF4178 domain-containing protein [Nitrospinae bacterium]|nr:DUF4178 domain-containing protein [Nitrospinota bacterium]
MTAACPSCGAPIRFKSSVSVFAVCQHCKTMSVRRGMDLEALGKTASMPEDLSPLQIGSRGKYKGNRFELVGRIRVGWKDGAWNEWYMLFEDGSGGWFGEAQGFYTVSFIIHGAPPVPLVKDIAPGFEVELADGRPFKVDDIKKAEYLACEGELPFSGETGRKSLSVDFSGGSGAYACVDYGEDGEVSLYAGEYVDFSTLKFDNLRDVGEGGISALNKSKAAAKMFKCPSCGGSVALRAPGQSLSVACQYCGSILDAKDENLRILEEARSKIKVEPAIPLGSRGKLSGAEWEVIGFMRRSDKTGVYFWNEYLLFNPAEGFRWLTEENGHWIFLEMIRQNPKVTGPQKATSGGREYSLFNKGEAKAVFVLGEFYWRVSVGETARVEDYIAPPEIICREKNDEEIIWSKGVHEEPADIAAAFGPEVKLPWRKGKGTVQPNPHIDTFGKVTKYLGAFLGAVVLIQLATLIFARSEVVFFKQYTFAPNDPLKVKVTDSFNVPGGVSNLEVRVAAPVDNSWVHTSFDLVDELTLETNEFGVGVEYYHGRDSDGDWSEGGRDNYYDLPWVKGGAYHLNLEAEGDPKMNGQQYNVTVVRDTPNWANFFLSAAALLAFYFFASYRKHSFEVARWANSDYSPYVSEDDD